MDFPRQAVRSCHCRHPFALASAFGLIAAILPTASLALPTNEFKHAPTPSSQITTLSPRQTSSITGDVNGNGDTSSGTGFNYYFVIIAVVAAAVLGFLVFKSYRRKQRNAVSRARGPDAAGLQHQTLGRGWPTNPVAYAHRQYYNQNRHVIRVNRAEGLDERGEAPPPYVPGTKPPSINTDPGLERVGSSRSVERRASSVASDVEMGDMTRPTYAPPSAPPPGYLADANASSGDSAARISRPEPAIIAGEGHGSSERHLDSADRNTHG